MGYPRYVDIRSAPTLLFLRGVRGYTMQPGRRGSYGRMQQVAMAGLVLLGYKYMRFNLKNEFEQREQPNPWVPRWVYQVRKEHHVYWENSRLARGKATTFTYYFWDAPSQTVVHVDQTGKQTFERNSFQTERPDIMDNPLFEQMYKSQDMGEEGSFARNNLLVAYHLALDDKYDLDNYL